MLTLCVFPIYITPPLPACIMYDCREVHGVIIGNTQSVSISFFLLFFFHQSYLYPIKIFVKCFYYYSLTALSCRDNFPVCVNEPANQRCEALRHYFISWSCDCHTFVNPLRNAISVRVCLSSLSLNEMPSFL